jgi:hypothetical protein
LLVVGDEAIWNTVLKARVSNLDTNRKPNSRRRGGDPRGVLVPGNPADETTQRYGGLNTARSCHLQPTNGDNRITCILLLVAS